MKLWIIPVLIIAMAVGMILLDNYCGGSSVQETDERFEQR